MTLGEKIYKLRAAKGFSQETFGERLGVSRQSVSKWETDQSMPELEKIIAMSELFGVSTDYLLKDEMERLEDISITAQGAAAAEVSHANTIRLHYEYKSHKTIWGLPLLHINVGIGAYRAKGFFAIGNMAAGIFAVGILSAGVVALAPLAVGLLAIGALAVGLLSLGTVAIGCIACGAIAVGLFSVGALAVGQFSFGALACGQQIAIGDDAYGNIALGFSHAAGRFYEEVSADNHFDYKTIENIINENVSSRWFPFREWMKGILRMMAASVR